ncbi:flagellar biosynthetic protein FliO [Stakelama tenebrarum]|uniref:Flagellar biogenesis protein n=1 Tax=Stakelama tenebrarum TaxID=2711215 RepID=A0A6G6Y477_9SPHN|nr:flagellar biosynthetic protein FliO [Sphingosinithalassobacter tenebrarum]QIG79710.1 flagellar biogenesis protein [Sphingosinithalassobacter tenebrarum]
MDTLSLLRTIGALGLLLGCLAGALWAVRRYDIKLPGRITAGSRKRVELVERLTLDPKRSVALIRRDGAEHLILLAPEGHLVVESAIARVGAEETANVDAASPVEATNDNLSDLRMSFAQLVEQRRERMSARHGG